MGPTVTTGLVTEMYADGGLLGSNGDAGVLGVWSYVLVGADGQCLRHRLGIVEPMDGMSIENNMVELVALMRGLRSLPIGWSGRVYSDNRNALGWTFPRFQDRDGYTKKHFTRGGVPPTLEECLDRYVARLGTVEAIHLDGHATAKELAKGKGKSGRPVSPWNNVCDAHCNAQKLLHVLGPAVRMTPEEAKRRNLFLRREDFARLQPPVVAQLAALGYPPPSARCRKGEPAHA